MVPYPGRLDLTPELVSTSTHLLLVSGVHGSPHISAAAGDEVRDFVDDQAAEWPVFSLDYKRQHIDAHGHGMQLAG